MSETQMKNEIPFGVRYGEAFWRAHHTAWQQTVLNQREYCEAHGIPLKTFGNWRAKFKAEEQPAERKLLYRRGGLSHALSHSLSHMTSEPPGPIGGRAGLRVFVSVVIADAVPAVGERTP
jgi:hypothetical protein